ncbi:hypothetical protein [Streptomyces xanthophaeus]
MDAVTNHPHNNGGPFRLTVCHSGSDGSWIAQRIANERAPPCAPADRVGTNRLGGTEQTPVIDKGGYWRVFLTVLEGRPE